MDGRATENPGIHAQKPDLPSKEGVNVNGRATETLGVHAQNPDLPSEEGVNVDGRATETPRVHAQKTYPLKCYLHPKHQSHSLVPRPSLTAFFAAVEKSVGKAWKQTSRDACHRFRHNKGSRVHL